ncbi:hypothetical protein MVLG_05037 [Microbotryum lychnidis-dioicae p1A1 Lamole]|uniref:DUF6534 domain-containing protein n=1 Tax=Microbotryum lychnidis-dioicae (strain p1A1 Lamole / MvSl-1064) TaxID=683840 RepID=U5HD17_USTV1|nr:hypothetical protein MVLG_05037 [Microbotryum lychnidis-dioicae p1A1 Lamole]|eukprot:KDE04569.1 hypothetical protein MVLG_05037 [Microbotryum lychnidis-dioicae p1A1 Lamole]
MDTPPVRSTLAPLLFGSWLNTGLFTLELLWMLEHFWKHPFSRGPRWISVTLLVLLLNDSISTISNYAAVWLYTIVHFGDYAYLALQDWTVVIFLITTGVSAMVVQFFLLERAWRLCRSGLKLNAAMTIMIALVALGILVSFSNCFWTAAYVFIYRNYTERYRVVTPVTVWLTISAGCDVTIAGILLFKLNQARKEVANRAHSNLLVPLQKLMIMALESGAVTSFVAIVGLGLYLGFKTTNLPLAPGYCLGRIYALTMLFNLRVRDRLQAEAISSQAVGVSTFALRADAPTDLSKDPHEFDVERHGVMSSVGGVSTIRPDPRRGQTSRSHTVQTRAAQSQTVQTISLETAYIMHCPTTPRIGGSGIGEESDGFDADSSLIEDREPRTRRPRRVARREFASSRRSSVSIPSVDDPMLATLRYVPRQDVSLHDLM